MHTRKLLTLKRGETYATACECEAATLRECRAELEALFAAFELDAFVSRVQVRMRRLGLEERAKQALVQLAAALEDCSQLEAEVLDSRRPARDEPAPRTLDLVAGLYTQTLLAADVSGRVAELRENLIRLLISQLAPRAGVHRLRLEEFARASMEKGRFKQVVRWITNGPAMSDSLRLAVITEMDSELGLRARADAELRDEDGDGATTGLETRDYAVASLAVRLNLADVAEAVAVGSRKPVLFDSGALDKEKRSQKLGRFVPHETTVAWVISREVARVGDVLSSGGE